jgi:hypothetical protein
MISARSQKASSSICYIQGSKSKPLVAVMVEVYIRTQEIVALHGGI